MNKRSGARQASVALAIVSLLLVALMVDVCGCGLETDEANAALARASKHQAEAEATLARFKNFPAEWGALFNVPSVGPDQITQARQLLQAREQDLQSLEKALKAWGNEISSIASLNVEDKIKEYVHLKMNSIKCWAEYTENFLTPLIKQYQGLVELMAQGQPTAELNKSVANISDLVKQSVEKLNECEGAEKQADDYFQENRLGE